MKKTTLTLCAITAFVKSDNVSKEIVCHAILRRPDYSMHRPGKNCLIHHYHDN